MRYWRDLLFIKDCGGLSCIVLFFLLSRFEKNGAESKHFSAC
jgi:hypothetical protein